MLSPVAFAYIEYIESELPYAFAIIIIPYWEGCAANE